MGYEDIKIWFGVAVVAVALGGIGCESDEFADAPTVQATASDNDDDGSYQQGSATSEEGQQGQMRASPGPVQGTERPPDHPTRNGASDQTAPAPTVDRPEPANYGQEGPIRWEAPEKWQPRPPANEMRFAEYDVVVPGGEGNAELTVFYFGAGGGSVEQNLERWAGQFYGGPEPTRQVRDVDGMTVHTLDVSGTYQTDLPMGGGQEPTEDQRLLGAIAEASQGLFFFRLTGDEEVVSHQREAFNAFVDTLEDAGG